MGPLNFSEENGKMAAKDLLATHKVILKVKGQTL